MNAAFPKYYPYQTYQFWVALVLIVILIIIQVILIRSGKEWFKKLNFPGNFLGLTLLFMYLILLIVSYNIFYLQNELLSGLYALILVLLTLYFATFFVSHLVGVSFFVIFLVWVSTLLFLFESWDCLSEKLVGLISIFFVWVSFVTFLNLRLWFDNFCNSEFMKPMN